MAIQHEKCCYCERKIPEEGLGKQVEHFRPQGRYPELRNHWPNLLLACGQCNHAKLAQFPTDSLGNPMILDPSDSTRDPEDHVSFIVDFDDGLFGTAVPKKGSPLGQKTIQVTKIGTGFFRSERVRHFFRAVEPILSSLREATLLKEEQRVQTWKLQLRDRMAADARFAGFVRAYARGNGLDDLLGVVIPSGAEV